jgi:hypothetical protein
LEQYPVTSDGGWNVLECPIYGERKDCLRWKRGVGAPRERRYVRVAGVAPDADIVPFTNDLDTLLRGVAERVFFVAGKDGFVPPVQPRSRVFARRLRSVLADLEPLLPSTAPVSHQAFADSYRGRKRQVYQRALDEIRAGRFNLEEDSRLRIFVKYEKTDRTIKRDPVPRVISPRDPRYNIKVGRYLKPLEKRLFKALDKLWGHTTIMKGLNATDTAKILREKWDRFREPVAIGLDAHRFDQHVSKEALIWEHGVYKRCFRERKHKIRLGQLLDRQLTNECHGYVPDGQVQYRCSGRRMSGDMNTSMGNCLLMTALVLAYSRHVGVECALGNNGDDCLVFMEKEDLDRFMTGLDQWFLEMGFSMAVEAPAFSFEEAEFCQTHPVFDGSDWIMVRNFSTAVVKDSVMLCNWGSSRLFRGWLDAVGTGGLALTGRLPVYQELYSCYVRSGERRPIPEDLLPWSFRTWKEGVNRAYGHVHPQARASFYYAFGITPDEQVQLERYYSKLCLGSSPVPYAYRTVFV